MMIIMTYGHEPNLGAKTSLKAEQARENVERLLRTASEEQGAWAQATVFLLTRVVGAAVGVAVVMADYRSASLLDMM